MGYNDEYKRRSLIQVRVAPEFLKRLQKVVPEHSTLSDMVRRWLYEKVIDYEIENADQCPLCKSKTNTVQ